MRAIALSLISIAVAVGASACSGQRMQDARIFAGDYDHDFTVPHAEGAGGQKDASAIRIIRAYLALASPTIWRGLTARGTLALEQSEVLSQFAATMTLDGYGRSRLDFTTNSGTRSIRMNGESGGVLYEGGRITYYPAAVSAAGMIPSVFTLHEALQRGNGTLVFDGVVNVQGTRMEKITYTRPALAASHAHQTSNLIAPLVTSLFFDPQSHLLVKAVDSVHYSMDEKNSHLRVFTYSDYRNTQGQMSPYELQETLDGRLSWRFNIAESESNCNQDSSYFSF